jgi:arsenite methyltransferase
MENSEKLKELVKEKYGAIAKQSKEQNETSCCGSGCCSTVDYSVFSDNYGTIKGYNPDADLGLGCGLPTEHALIKNGDTVIDLGSGAGNDCFVARALTGEKGKVIGIDFTPAMIEKARENAEKLGFNNVEFRMGDIEHMPVSANKADVIISNCVLNLVPDKQKVFSEIFRVLKPGGHFSISDVVLNGELPEHIRKAGEMYAGCVSGASQREDYLQMINQAGLIDVKIQKEKSIVVPDNIMLSYLNQEELNSFKKSGAGIFSITVYAKKTGKSSGECGCGDCGC